MKIGDRTSELDRTGRPLMARGLAYVVGSFYLLSGGWAFLFPSGFYTTVATFTPYNLHLLHDAGAFQIGLGASLVAAAVSARSLAPVLLGVMVGSLLHLFAHLIDVRLGGHPATDLPILALIVVVLATALVLELRTNIRTRSS
jgi:hypothetical protein